MGFCIPDTAAFQNAEAKFIVYTVKVIIKIKLLIFKKFFIEF